jgi:hypothetical protein
MGVELVAQARLRLAKTARGQRATSSFTLS